MTNENETKTLHYFIVADASGSMSDQIDEVRMELNNHFKMLKSTAEKTGDTIKVSLITFDTEIEWKFTGVLAKNLPIIGSKEYFPGGMTALYDAVGRTVQKANYLVGSIQSEKEVVWVMVFSDGGENASRRFHYGNLKALLDEFQTKPNWNITFTGCDFTALSEMQAVNFRQDRTREYLHHEKARAFRDLNVTMSSFLEKRMTDLDFQKPEDEVV